MANKKQQIKQEKDTYRKRYRNFKELRWWIAGLLAVCIIITSVLWTVRIGNVLNRVAELDEAVEQGTVGAAGAFRGTVITGGETKVSLMALSYYYYDAFYTIKESDNFTSDYKAYGLDPEKPLKESEYTALRTWFDELLTKTYEGVDDVVRYAEIARKAGTTLSAEEEKAVEDKIKTLTERAEKEGTTLVDYIDKRYTSGMTVEDLRAAIRLYALGEKQYGIEVDRMLQCTDGEIEAYYEANASSLITADYAFFKFYGKEKEQLASMEKSFTDCKTKEEFLGNIEKNLKNQGLTDKQVSDYVEQSVRRIDYTEKDEMSKWAFETNKGAGDSFVEYGEEDGNVYCVVYHLIRPGEKVLRPSANARSIMISGDGFTTPQAAKAQADKIYNLAVEDGTEEYFATLAKNHSFDLDVARYGGEYADIVPGDVVEEYEEWVFEDGRKYGDIGMVKSGDDYHIIFFIKSGDPCWKVTAKNAMVDERMERFAERIKTEIPLIKDEATVNTKLPDNLATEYDRDYVVLERDGKLVYKITFKFTTVLAEVIMSAVSLVALGFTVWAFVYTAKLKKKYGYE